MNGWNAPPPRGVSAALRQAPPAARQLQGVLVRYAKFALSVWHARRHTQPRRLLTPEVD
jgi:hypothetical protein